LVTKKTNAKEAENSEADESIPTSRSIRLKLQVPSRTQLQSDAIITNTTKNKKPEETNPFLD
jgi:hypothetical protein